jgi:hypothetical protein
MHLSGSKTAEASGAIDLGRWLESESIFHVDRNWIHGSIETRPIGGAASSMPISSSNRETYILDFTVGSFRRDRLATPPLVARPVAVIGCFVADAAASVAGLPANTCALAISSKRQFSV